MRRNPFKQYIRMLLAAGSLTTLVFFAYATIRGHLPANFWIFRCNASQYSDEFYLSYCGDPAFGDYEHGALFFGGDKESVKNLKRSKVLFLGNSRSMQAFSSEYMMNYFYGRGIPYFILAMGYGELDIFPKRVIERHDLSPSVIVVSADYFFHNSASKVAKKVMGGDPNTILEYKLKKWIQPLHKAVCGSGDHPLNGLLCGDQETNFKSRINGRNVTPVTPEDRKIPVAFVGEPPWHMIPELVANARRFKSLADERKACMVITVVPSKNASPAIGREIAKRLGLPFVLPKVNNLVSYDGNHLSPENADRWMRAFIPKFEPVLDKCLARKTARARKMP